MAIKKSKFIIFGSLVLVWFFRDTIKSFLGIIKKPLNSAAAGLQSSQYGLNTKEMQMIIDIASTIRTEIERYNSNEGIIVKELNKCTNPPLFEALKELYTDSYNVSLQSDVNSAIQPYIDASYISQIRTFIKKDLGYD